MWRDDADPLSKQGDDCVVLKISHEPILASELSTGVRTAEILPDAECVSD
jgi:hypothetical protein